MHLGLGALYLEHLETVQSKSNLTPSAGVELRSAPSGPDDRDRVTGERGLGVGGGGWRGMGHKVNTVLRGVGPAYRVSPELQDAPSTRS